MDKNEPKSPSGMDETFNGEDALAMVDFSLPPGYFTWLVRRSTLPPSGTLLYPVDPAPLRAKIAEQEAELAALRAENEALRERERLPVGPDRCPFTGRGFWGNIEHPDLGLIATYGGPFDTYTIPQREDNDPSYFVHRFDHDHGSWVEDEGIGKAVVDDQLYTSEDDPAELRAENEALREFAKEIMDCWPEGGVDGEDVQAIAAKHGLIEPEQVTQPCGENCACAEFDDFPQTCYRKTPLLTGKEGA